MTSKTFYQILQVDEQASPEVIEAAYRRLARMHHPDLNPSNDAVQRMQAINEAYAVLRDSARRTLYDLDLQSARRRTQESKASPRPEPPTSPPPETKRRDGEARPRPAPHFDPWDFYAIPPVPAHCEKCGRSDASLRIAAFPYAVSILIVSMRRAWSGLYCEECRRSEMNKARLISLCFGWWGIPFGPIFTLQCLFTPGEGKVPANLNAPYLAALGLRFLKAGQIDQGVFTLDASLKFEHDPQVVELLNAARRRQASSVWQSERSTTAGSWHNESSLANEPAISPRRPSWAAWLATLAAIAVLAFLWTAFVPNLSPTNARLATVPTRMPLPTTASMPTTTPTQAPTSLPAKAPTIAAKTPLEGQVVAVGDNVKLYQGPGLSYPSTIPMPQGEYLTALGQQDDCKWIKVRMRSGEEGWVRGDYVTWLTHCKDLALGTYRPKTQTLLPVRGRNLHGVFKVENGPWRDAVIVLVNESDETATSAYIRNGETHILERIPDGAYSVYFALGKDWNGQKFTSSAAYARFDDKLVFETTRTEYPGWQVTLPPIIGQTTGVSLVPKEAFPPIE